MPTETTVIPPAPESPAAGQPPLPIQAFDNALGRRIIELHRWAVREGLQGASVEALFNGFCRQLVADGVKLWRGYAAMRTLHPQWSGYGFTWRREHTSVQEEQFERNTAGNDDPTFGTTPVHHLLVRAEAGEPNPRIRRRLAAGAAERDFPVLEEFYAAGATDYFAQVFTFGDGIASQGGGVFFSFTGDGADGFAEDDLALIQTALPALSLAVKAEASHVIASGLLSAYLGEDAGRRVHAGAVERGSVESVNAVIWYADIRGFTGIADSEPGLTVVRLLDEVFETLTAPLRRRGGQVMKFIGDAMLATLSFEAVDRAEACRRALDAVTEAMQALDTMNNGREFTMLPAARVDFALHLGEVLYGNIGAADRLDFTVIGPAVNEVDRIEKLCEPLGRSVLVSSAFAAAAGQPDRLVSLGKHLLRGVREPREIFGLASET
ncbi:MAG TPA: adenylate/guanylate cyclase domain-containing protein [Stellaceae bacterium]|jgi:adenylate cyclase|nr:adenylate/guanylate cyclase domain-containing protein [Stellaceae bacterium]